ncbi:hypothetical protein [Sphingosinithalassobacter portus]|uniref:hypothetical protein n=1 Tax=Stakelama portus TaxID=2676234 RepID=UPI000D6E64E1|nr:hypothetical protein [Sphingosinithalassobacter portus]
MTDDIRRMWREDAKDATGLSLAEIHARVARLRRRLFRRDAIEYAAGAIVVGVFGLCAVIIPDWGIRISCIVLIIGTLIVLRNLWTRRMSATTETLGEAGASFYRRELVRQRDSLRHVWRWYLAPFVPGTLLFLLTVWHAMAEKMSASAAALPVMAMLVVDVVLFVTIDWLNRRAARALDTEIDALDRAIEGE